MIHFAACPVALTLIMTLAAPPTTRPAATLPASRPALLARVDARIELMSIIFRLAGNREYNQAAKSSYLDAVEKHFTPFRDHPAVQMARRLHAERGISYDAVAAMAIHIDNVVNCKERIPFDHPDCKLDSRWTPDDARTFLKQLRRFVKDTSFQDFLTEQEIFYTAAAIRMNELLGRRDFLQWLDNFFGTRANARYEVIVGLLNGPCNYGTSIRLMDRSEEITPTMGVWRFDHGVPEFRDEVIPVLIHEFSHPYSNPLVQKYASHLEDSGQRIFATCAETMRQQAYGHWNAMLCESMVRACVVRYMYAKEGRIKGWAQVREEEGRGFVWTGDLAKLLEEYEKHRDLYPTLDAFMPKVVEFFDHYAEKAEAQAARRPKVVSMTPKNGAKDVDPDLKEMKIVFDRPMKDKMWAVVGGGPNYPEVKGKISYDRQRKVLTIPVRLKPGWTYEFWLNRNQFNSFQSEEGARLESVPVRFQTRPKDGQIAE